MIYVTKKLPSDTRLRFRTKKPSVTATIFSGKKVILIQYLKTLQRNTLTVLPAQGKTQSNRIVFGQDKSDEKTETLMAQTITLIF